MINYNVSENVILSYKFNYRNWKKTRMPAFLARHHLHLLYKQLDITP